jgi:hypothetical protein
MFLSLGVILSDLIRYYWFPYVFSKCQQIRIDVCPVGVCAGYTPSPEMMVSICMIISTFDSQYNIVVSLGIKAGWLETSSWILDWHTLDTVIISNRVWTITMIPYALAKPGPAATWDRAWVMILCCSFVPARRSTKAMLVNTFAESTGAKSDTRIRRLPADVPHEETHAYHVGQLATRHCPKLGSTPFQQS